MHVCVRFREYIKIPTTQLKNILCFPPFAFLYQDHILNFTVIVYLCLELVLFTVLLLLQIAPIEGV